MQAAFRLSAFARRSARLSACFVCLAFPLAYFRLFGFLQLLTRSLVGFGLLPAEHIRSLVRFACWLRVGQASGFFLFGSGIALCKQACQAARYLALSAGLVYPGRAPF